MHIREHDGSRADYEAAVALDHAVWPDSESSVEGWIHHDRSRDQRYFQLRLLGERDGRVIGSGYACEPFWSYAPGKYLFHFNLHPEYLGQGLLALMCDEILNRLAPRSPTLLQTEARENEAERLGVLAERGFATCMRQAFAWLDLARYDAERFAPSEAKAAAAGYALYDFAELTARDRDCRRKFFNLRWAVVQDVPNTDALTKPSFAQFCKERFDHPQFWPEGLHIAVERASGRYVGLSSLHLMDNPSQVTTNLTGILPAHRRRGLATALKHRSAMAAKARGATRIVTQNEEHNPMLELNLAMGFEPQPTSLFMEKTISEGRRA